MNGTHIQNTPIMVDYWRTKNLPPRMLFFLTHMHADHTSGLSSSWPYPIHCTSLTGRMMVEKFNIDPKLVVELQLQQPKLVHAVAPCTHSCTSITVTAIEAYHCPGACMFLYEGYFGRILYTGDFRYCPGMVHDPFLNNSRSVDVLYLDNTYCDPSCVFPTREEAMEKMAALIQSNCNGCVYIGLHNLGKEDLLVKLAMWFNTCIGVGEEKMKLLKLLEMPNVFSCDQDMCWIRTVPFHTLTKDRISEVCDQQAIGILPTCLFVGEDAVSPPLYAKVVPYSDHSSFEELRQFVGLIRPRQVRPLVKKFTGEGSSIRAKRSMMAVFDDLLDPVEPLTFTIPNAIREILSSTSAARNSISTHSGGHIHSSCSRRRPYFSSTRLRVKARGVQFISPEKKRRNEEEEAAFREEEEEEEEEVLNEEEEEEVLNEEEEEVLNEEEEEEVLNEEEEVLNEEEEEVLNEEEEEEVLNEEEEEVLNEEEEEEVLNEEEEEVLNEEEEEVLNEEEEVLNEEEEEVLNEEEEVLNEEEEEVLNEEEEEEEVLNEEEEEVLNEEEEVLNEEEKMKKKEKVLEKKGVGEEYPVRGKLMCYRDTSKEVEPSFKMVISDTTTSRTISGSNIPYNNPQVCEKLMWTPQPQTTCSRMIPVGHLRLRNSKFGRKIQSPEILKHARSEDAVKDTGPPLLREKTPPTMFARNDHHIPMGVVSRSEDAVKDTGPPLLCEKTPTMFARNDHHIPMGVALEGIETGWSNTSSSHLNGKGLNLSLSPRISTSSVSIVSNSLTSSSINPLGSPCTSINPRTPVPSSSGFINPVTTRRSLCVASTVGHPLPHSVSELMAKQDEVETIIVSSSDEERFGFGRKHATMSSLLQRELYAVGVKSKRTVELLPLQHSAIKSNNHKTHSSPSVSVSSTPSLPHAAVGASSGVLGCTSIRGDIPSLGSVAKSPIHVHKKHRTLPLAILGRSGSSPNHSLSREEDAGFQDYPNLVTGSCSPLVSMPVLRGTPCKCNTVTERNCKQSLRVVLPNLEACFDQVLCYTQQDQQQHQQQQVCMSEWVEDCALCLSGLGGLCSKLLPHMDCRCNGCLRGIKHLFEPNSIL